MERITKVSSNCIKLTALSEGLKLNAYKCPAGVWTIGYGSTYYEDGTRVKQGDVVTKERAESLLLLLLQQYEKGVDSMTIDTINQNQFDALVDFAYNCGLGNLKISGLLKKVNANPNDSTIEASFKQWVYGGDGSHNKVDDDGDGLIDETGEKQRLGGLVTRRQNEANLYFGKL